MKAIILAAGFGNRMKPLTLTQHKTLLSIGDKTILGRIIDSLLENEINDIVVATGYLKEDIETYLKDGYPDTNFIFVHNERYASTNNIYTLSLVLESIEIDTDFLLIESDLIYDSSIITKLVNDPNPTAAVISSYRNGLDGTVVSINSKSQINAVYPPHLQDVNFDLNSKYKTLNIYKFSQDYLLNDLKSLLIFYANSIDENCYYELIVGLLIYMRKKYIHGLVVSKDLWEEVDDPNDLRIAAFRFDKSKRLNILNKSFGGFWSYDILDFAFIRNMYFPDEALLNELKKGMVDCLQNYGSSQEILNRKMSYAVDLPQDGLVALNGGTQIYPILRRWFGDKKVAIPNVTFGEYTDISGNIVYYSNLNDIDTPSVAGVVIVNPNNPDGSIIRTNDIVQFALENSEATIIVDESFIDFSSESSIAHALISKRIKNILIIYSMSKTFGLPGIRLGYCYTLDSVLHTYIMKELPIWGLNSLGELYLELILKRKPSLIESFRKTIRDREFLFTELVNVLGADSVFRSHANFILFKTESGSDLGNKMLNQGIYIKDISSKYNDGLDYFRVAVRDPQDNVKLINALKNCF